MHDLLQCQGVIYSTLRHCSGNGQASTRPATVPGRDLLYPTGRLRLRERFAYTYEERIWRSLSLLLTVSATAG